MASGSDGIVDEGLGIKRIKQVKNKSLVSKRRSQITTAALNLFLEKGYHATTIRDIARRSGVNQGSLYDYVKNKEDILRLLLEKTVLPSSEYPVDLVDFRKKFGSLKEYLTHQFRYSWTQNRKGILLSYRVSESLKKGDLKNLLSRDKAIVDRMTARIRMYTKIKDEDKRVEIIANIINFLNAFIPMRDWNLKAYELDAVLEVVVEMILKALDVKE